MTINPPMRPKPGTAGVPLPGFAIRVSDDGEVLGKGENVIVGYQKNQDQIKEAVVDGWFNCRAFGKLDDDGYLVLDKASQPNAA